MDNYRAEVYAAMNSLHEEGVSPVSIKKIVDYLVHEKKVSANKQNVYNILRSAGADIHKHSRGAYSLMNRGYQKIPKDKGLIHLQQDSPFLAKSIAVSKIFSDLSGDVLIQDQYCGVALLDLIPKDHSSIRCLRVLTKKIQEKIPDEFQRAIRALQKQGLKIEVRISPQKIHDRFMVNGQRVWYSGGSFKDLGVSESWVINLDHLSNAFQQRFDELWQSSRVQS